MRALMSVVGVLEEEGDTGDDLQGGEGETKLTGEIPDEEEGTHLTESASLGSADEGAVAGEERVVSKADGALLAAKAARECARWTAYQDANAPITQLRRLGACRHNSPERLRAADSRQPHLSDIRSDCRLYFSRAKAV